ncbi:hypothetical protein AWN90_40050 [Nocardia terpenica]|uniref:Uncharacterized protein n=2 Tax=Nocardia terpenica TaxID=455432 RepID=A0A164JVA8_9NOCA|nr:hypothetical protein AWN90_40050 [Nocardia terpenica]
MTPRELLVLVDELPGDSRYKRARSTAWTLQENLTARLINELQDYRRDYRNAHGAEHHVALVTPPELPHETTAREAAEHRRAHHRALGPAVLERMLRGELRMTDIDPTRPIEEALGPA